MIIRPRPHGWQLLYILRGSIVPAVAPKVVAILLLSIAVAALAELWHPPGIERVSVAPFTLLGWGNWFLIPFAAVGAVIAAIGILFTHASKRGRAWTGLVLNGIVVVVGIVRLGLGGGIV